MAKASKGNKPNLPVNVRPSDWTLAHVALVLANVDPLTALERLDCPSPADTALVVSIAEDPARRGILRGVKAAAALHRVAARLGTTATALLTDGACVYSAHQSYLGSTVDPVRRAMSYRRPEDVKRTASKRVDGPGAMKATLASINGEGDVAAPAAEAK